MAKTHMTKIIHNTVETEKGIRNKKGIDMEDRVKTSNVHF